MRVLTVTVALVLFLSLPLFAEEFKVRIDGQPDDVKSLLDHLNENGKDENVHFTLADSDYQYRIAVYIEGKKGSDFLTGGGADATAVVLSPNCELVFAVTRGGRATKGGATNALSKEVAKKMKELPASK